MRPSELAIADMSVDVVTTRSVLIYVADKARAFAEMRRVLRSQGRLSIFEPINSLMYPEPPDRFYGYNVADVQALAERVRSSYHRLSDPLLIASSPLTCDTSSGTNQGPLSALSNRYVIQSSPIRAGTQQETDVGRKPFALV